MMLFKFICIVGFSWYVPVFALSGLVETTENEPKSIYSNAVDRHYFYTYRNSYNKLVDTQ